MPRRRQIIRQNYRTLKYEISKKDVEDETFELSVNRRKLSQATMKAIYRLLERNEHFDAVFVVNKKNGKYRLIDGNNRYGDIRYGGICKYLAVNPDHRVEVTLHIYDNLNEKEEKEIYTRYNLGRKQSTNDFVQQYKEEIHIWKLLSDQRNFPVRITVYGGAGAISFYKLVGTYIATKALRFAGGYIGEPLKFIEDSKQLGHNDVAIMAAFIKDFQQAFGPIRNNKWLRTTPFTATMKIWYDNHKNMLPPRIVNAFRTKLANDAEAIDLGKNSGMGACKWARDKFLMKLNEGRNTNLFIDGDQDNGEEIEEEDE